MVFFKFCNMTTYILKLQIIGFIISCLLSCTKEQVAEPATETFIQNNCQADSGLVRITAHPTVVKNRQIIGAGLDIMGEYLDNSSIKAPIVDISKYALGWEYTVSKSLVSYPEIFVGPSAVSILDMLKSDFEIEVPEENFNDQLFTETITNKYKNKLNDSYDFSSQFSFMILNSIYVNYSYNIRDVLPKRFTSEFENDLQNLTAEEIISKYGTHVIQSAAVGLSTMSYYRSLIANMPLIKDDYNTSNNTIMEAYSYNQNSVHFYSHPNEHQLNYDYSIPSYGSSVLMDFRGGDHTKVPNDYCSINNGCKYKDVDVCKEYYNSLTDDNMSLSTMYNSIYIPIYRIVEYDPELSNRIKQATINHIKSKQITIIETKPLFQVFSDKNYRYTTEYSENNNGVIASLFGQPHPGTEPLYRYSNADGDRLSFDADLIATSSKKDIIGYCYKQVDTDLVSLDTLYEISDGRNFIYQLNDPTCNLRGWKMTGEKIYTRKINGL